MTQFLLRQIQGLFQSEFCRVRSSASCFNLRYQLFSRRPSTSCVRLPPHLPIPCIFPSVTCFRRQFLWKMWQIQLGCLYIENSNALFQWRTVMSWKCNLRYPFFWGMTRRHRLIGSRCSGLIFRGRDVQDETFVCYLTSLSVANITVRRWGMTEWVWRIGGIIVIRKTETLWERNLS